MTRKTRRDIERALDELTSEVPTGPLTVISEDPWTGEFHDSEGNQVDPEAATGNGIIINQSVVMGRERALEEGYEIVGPAEGVPKDRDVVKVRKSDSGVELCEGEPK